jgi:hypothetical protein
VDAVRDRRAPTLAIALAAGWLMTAALGGAEPPPPVLEVYRDRLERSARSTFDAIERDAAKLSAELRFPHAHFAMESESGPLEVWWLNAFESEADRARVTEEYQKNQPIVAALGTITARRRGIVTGEDAITKYRPDLSAGPWQVAGIRFFVVQIVPRTGRVGAAVFEAPGGPFFAFRPARTRDDALRIARAAGPDARVFAVQPQWGMPATSWIAADPEFWRPNPMASQAR